MPRESFATLSDRTRKIISLLRRTYPDAHCELNFSNPLELLIATILSAQCSDKQVNLVTARLFKTFRTAKEFAEAPLPEIEAAVKTTGFFRNKARNIKACCTALVDKFGGEVPRTMDELHALAGVGRKTANVVLGNAFGLNVGGGRGHPRDTTRTAPGVDAAIRPRENRGRDDEACAPK